MPAKAASDRATAKVAAKSARFTGANPDTRSAQISKCEAEGNESFKALMKKYAGKLQFAGYDR